MLSAERLRELLRYDPKTGKWFWLASPNQRIRVGSEAGSLMGSGHRMIKAFGCKYLAHRLAWLYMTGEWPNDDVDHKNGKPDDNRWCNLRLATASQNIANSKRRRDNTSGFKGVSYHRHNRSRSKKWRAVIFHGGRQHYLGHYTTPEEAHAAYCAAAKDAFGKFARSK
jgi:hypothetical protein